MVETMIISIIVSVVLGVLLWDRHMEYRKLAGDRNPLQEFHIGLLLLFHITRKFPVIHMTVPQEDTKHN